MQISVTFKNQKSSDHFKSYIINKLNRFDKLFNKPSVAEVVLRAEKLRKIAEINISGDKLSIQAKEENEDLHAAIDLALDKVRKQIVRNKQKRQERKLKKRHDPFDELHGYTDYDQEEVPLQGSPPG